LALIPQNGNAETQPERGLQSARSGSGINSACLFSRQALREPLRRALKFSCEVVSLKGIGDSWIWGRNGSTRSTVRAGFFW